MKILLDTHLLLWWMADAEALPEEARAAIRDLENTIFISAVTLWEIHLKQSLGKLRLPAAFEDRLREESFEHLPLTAAHTRAIASMPWHHRDPFDRMLIAQAQAEGFLFFTADETAGRYGSWVRVVR